MSNCAAECWAPAASPERIGQPPTVHPPQGSSSYMEDNHGHFSTGHREHTPTHRCPLHPGGGQHGHLAHVHPPSDAEAGASQWGWPGAMWRTCFR